MRDHANFRVFSVETMQRGAALGCLLLLLVPCSCANHSASWSVSERIRTSCCQLTASDTESRLRAESELLKLAKSHPVEVAAEYDRQTERLSAFRGVLVQAGVWQDSRALTQEVMQIRSKAIACLNEMATNEQESSIRWVYEALASVARNGHQVPPEFSQRACAIVANPEMGALHGVCIFFLSDVAASDSTCRRALEEIAVAPLSGEVNREEIGPSKEDSHLMAIGGWAISSLAHKQLPGLADFLGSAYRRLDNQKTFDTRRLIILREIARLQAKESLPWVLQAANDPRHDWIVEIRAATLCAALLGDESSINMVLDPMQQPYRIESKLPDIFEVLGQTGKKEHVAFIREKGLRPGKVMYEAIEALVRLDAIGKNELSQVYDQYCNKDSRIAMECRDGLARYVEDMTFEELASMIDKPQSEFEKIAVAEAIVSKRARKGVAFLTSVMEHDPEENRVAAARGLSKGFLREYKPLILRVARQGMHSNNDQVRIASLLLLINAAEKKEIWEVFELLSSPDSDTGVRACAAAVLVGLTDDMPEEVPESSGD